MQDFVILGAAACLAAVLLWGGSVEGAAGVQEEGQGAPEARSAEQGPPPAEVPGGRPGSEGPSVPSPEDPDRIRFEIRFPPEEGGGTAAGTATALEYEREGHAVASGRVDIRYQDLQIRAERIAIDRDTKLLTAEGGVVLDQGHRRLTGETLTFDLESKTGELRQATAYVQPDMYFKGTAIAKVGEDTYTITDGVFTSCTDDVPDWSFRLGRARVTVEGYARVHDTTMRLKRVPVLYLPYMLWPAKTDRSSGFLIPNLGYSRRRGALLGLAYYQVLGDSYDTTVFLDLYGEEFIGLGNEFRYRPTPDTEGIFRGYLIDDPVEDETRWKVRWDHESRNLPWGMRGVLSFSDFSDFEFFRDFERDLNDVSTRSIYSSGFLTGNWGAHSLNVLLDSRETFLGGGSVVQQRQLPEVEYRLRPTRLGRLPLYLQLLSSVHYLSLERSAALESDYGRADLFPQLTLPLRSWPWLSISLSGGGRATWYGDSLAQGAPGFSGDSLTRTFPVAGAEIIGPSFSRIFDASLGPYGRFKHVVEPRWSYTFIDEFDEGDEVPLFDEVDTVRPVNLGSWALVNRLLAKTAAADGAAREILSLEIGQAFSFDSDRPLQRSRDGLRTEAWGPLTARLRFTPGTALGVHSQLSYSTLFGHLESTSVSATYSGSPVNLGLTWFTRFDAESGDTRADQVRVFSGFDVLPARLRLETQLSYDIEQDLLQQQRWVIHYNSQCFGLRLEAREFRAFDRRDRDFRFSVTLKNVGTFLDLTGGQSEEF